MNQPENKTILNDVAKLAGNSPCGVYSNSQLTQVILNGIQAGRRNFKPYIPNKMCQFPNPSKSDDFSTTEGLGTMSLQSVIDGLNSFKTAAINEIKTKFQAMGPENAKDVKLAAGAVLLIKDIYDAAKCFTQIVTQVNNLVNSYISSVNVLIVSAVNKISQLEAEINQIKLMLLVPTTYSFLVNVCGAAAADRIAKANGMYDLLGAVVELQNALAEADRAADTLLSSDRRVIKHLTIGLTVLQNRINSFFYYQSLKGCLDINLASANGSFMQDDFLDNFEFTDVEEASFNWSLTNSGGIFDCNIDDELHIIPRLNDMARNFGVNTSSFVTIASRNEEGWIVVPDDTEGLIAAGLDPRLGADTNLIFDLSINNGETIVRSIASGKQLGPNDQVMVRTIGSYQNYGKETFDYNKVIDNGDDTFSLYFIDETKKSDIVLGSIYKFINPITQSSELFSWRETAINKDNYFPVLYKVIDVTNRFVKVKILNNTELTVNQFIPGALPANYTFILDAVAPPGNLDGKVLYDTTSGNILTNPIFTWPSATITTPGGDVLIPAQLTADGVHYREDLLDPVIREYVELNSVTLNKYNLINLVNKVPHAGEKIRCHNWALNVRISGNPNKINDIKFSTSYPGQLISLFFLKAKWGFIPVNS